MRKILWAHRIAALIDRSRSIEYNSIQQELRKIKWEERARSSGSVIFQIRSRAKKFDFRAYIAFVFLSISIVVGLIFYVMRPILENRDRILSLVYERVEDRISNEIEQLNTKRQDLKDIISHELKPIILDQSVDAVTENLKDVQYSPEGEAVIVGDSGTILTRAHFQEDWEVLRINALSSNLSAVRFSSSGEAIAVGENGAIVTREAGSVEWIVQSIQGLTQNLTDIKFGESGEVVVVGWDGAVVTRSPNEKVWKNRTLERSKFRLTDVAFGEDDEVLIVGDHGIILTRETADRWELNRYGENSSTLHAVDYDLAGRPFIVGEDGILISRNSRESDWEIIYESVGSEILGEIEFDRENDGNGVIIGNGGVIITRISGENIWQRSLVDGIDSDLTDVQFGPNGSVIVVGKNGTLLTRTNANESWTLHHLGIAANFYDIRVGPGGVAAVIGDDTTIIYRSSEVDDWIPLRWFTVASTVVNEMAFSPSGDALIVGDNGTIAKLTGDFSTAARASTTDSELMSVIESLPNQNALAGKKEELAAIITERARLNKDLQTARQNISLANSGKLSRIQVLEELEEFLSRCQSIEPNDAKIADCGEIYEKVVERRDSQNWWQLIAEVLPPAILFIFLLVMLGRIYRYNLRMAGFYHARADALFLYSQSNELLEGEKLSEVVELLAADRIDLRPENTPIDGLASILNSILQKFRLG